MRRIYTTICLCGIATFAAAHETDQYSVPVGREYADLGSWFTQRVHDDLTIVVEKLNDRIRSCERTGCSQDRLDRLRSQEEAVGTMFLRFPAVITQIDQLEWDVHAPSLRREYPGRITGHKPSNWIYRHWLLAIDATKLVRQIRTSTIKINDVYLGTDKIAHFAHMGYLYYRDYAASIRAGKSEEEAIRSGMTLGSGAHPVVSESTVLGLLTTGVFSNADLVANYSGFKFYRNLTESVRVGGQMRPPLLIVQNGYWRLNDHVRPDSDFFTVYFTPHFDEALNPNDYAFGVTPIIRSAIKARCENVRMWYVDENGDPQPKRYFEELARELTTYYGEAYGHVGDLTTAASIANCCFDETADPEAQLHAAARAGDVEAVRQAISTGTEVDATLTCSAALPAQCLETPLHVAAKEGQLDAARALLLSGSNVNALTVRRVTPLHRAIADPELASLLIRRGANIDAPDDAGRTPLHWAVREQEISTVELLLRSGANVNAVDHDGEAPLHDAARMGLRQIAGLLLSHGADATAEAVYRTTPLHLAARFDHDDVAHELLSNGASIAAVDEFGWTALHSAAAAGSWRVAALLADEPALADAVDSLGNTPADVATAQGHDELALALQNGSGIQVVRASSPATRMTTDITTAMDDENRTHEFTDRPHEHRIP